MPLRGKKSEGGVFQDLLKFRVDAGDHILETQLKNCAKNARYTSVSTQNELIKISEELLWADNVGACNDSGLYSILADESADNSGTEQFTRGIRFVDMQSEIVREEFVGMVSLGEINAEAISTAILQTLEELGLNLKNLVGQGYDVCSSMSGCISGLQARIRKKQPRALYFHYASHRLNLLVNKANLVPEVRNAVAPVKAAIKFFRESPLRRKHAPALPLFCDTR
ncbi:zinc finger MYM-type protein 1-like [Ixodes scapularis]